MIELDGSFMEGGGQICRSALAFSVLTGKDFVINNIRKGRTQPGLKAQHLYAVKALEKMCGCSVEGLEIGSERLVFRSMGLPKKSVKIDIGTAGSVTLLMQSLLIPCCLAQKRVKVEITGGTDVKWSMPWDYFKEVIIPRYRKICDIDAKLIKRGFYPKGGGKVEIVFKPKFNPESIMGVKPLILEEQGKLVQIKGVSFASMDLAENKVAERQKHAAQSALSNYGVNVDIRSEYSDTLSTGSGVVLWAKFANLFGEMDFNNPVVLGSDVLGERGKKSELVGEEAALNLRKEIDSCVSVDSHAVDNLVPILGLLGGKIKVNELSSHAKTNIWTVEQFLGKVFEVSNGILRAKTI